MKKLDCVFEERKSVKTGNYYKALFIKLNNNNKYEKVVLLSAPEIALIEQDDNQFNNQTSNLESIDELSTDFR